MSAADPPFGSQLPEVRVQPPGPNSKAFAQRLRAVESRNITYVSDEWPVFWDEAFGSNVRDADGNVFIDLTSAFGVALLGHSSELARSVIADQAPRLIHGMGDIHPPTMKLQLLERLSAMCPWPDTKVVLSSTGSEACETALKTAQIATDRPGVIAFEGGYHGLTMGSLAVTERAHFRSPFSRRSYGGVTFVPFPDLLHDGPDAAEASLSLVADALTQGAPNGDPIGTVIVEPIQARGGARIPPGGFMKALSDLAHDAGALVVADEIFTGLGRCGAFIASPDLGLEPDLLCLGKSLGLGLPISACAAPAAVMDAWPESRGEAVHTSTFLGHPLACAAGAAFLDRIESDAVCERAAAEGEELKRALVGKLEGLAGVADVRGRGLLLGIEFSDAGGGRAEGMGARVAQAALGRGLILLPAGDEGHVLELSPPLGLSEGQVQFVAQSIADVVGDIG